MRIVVPYTRLHPDTAAALDWYQPEYVDVSADDQAYWRSMCRRWSERQTFINVEHDIVPLRGALQALWDCPQPWCAYPYELMKEWRTACLGCAKFSGDLQARFPDLVERAGKTWVAIERGERVYGSDWQHLDMAMALWLTRRIGPVHWHPAGMVEHRLEDRCLVT